LKLLLEWADACLEKSLNQPILPHAVIVLNAVEVSSDENRWEVEQATRSLLHDNRHLISKDAYFSRLRSFWRSRGSKIETTEDLLRCYYGSINVVRIPVKSPSTYMFIREQVAKLRETIDMARELAFERKTISRMLASVDELSKYLQAGFDHFARELHEPFNFSKIAMKDKPIPQDMGDHILGIAAAVQTQVKQPGEQLFLGLSRIVASCIIFDIVRRGHKGTPSAFLTNDLLTLASGPTEELFKTQYAALCRAALYEFCRTTWPCEFQDKKGRVCANFQSTHLKGHQDSNGKVIGAGEYTSSFNPDNFGDRWVQVLAEDVKKLNNKLLQLNLQPARNSSEKANVLLLHQQNLDDFYRHLRVGEHYHLLATCICCLTEVPQHLLPCGHVLCTSCVKDFGHRRDEYCISIERCPLHPDDADGSFDWQVRFKPNFAGVRILSLDG
jgi:hypothetical protein